ncbi:ribulose-phosphate 3-epimerase [Eubacterium barkeri]|uniref:Ribulose-phosphate 3-epimerase n=1 Tax=Eubacterium barkeri TaxID=1528 RepID=A0A1H3JKZ0_EUBBA|nr:ribulose-phosphate 3-epimerase [Eubacterium barkeri]SDY40581.1 ribulose-phosphate 3-epimerase [Eubacterium barkeri]
MRSQIKVSASVSCMDLCNLERSIEEVEQSEVAFYHFDVVDGRFNTCFILGETTLQQMKEKVSLPIEVHLAVYEPEKYIERFIEAGADYVAVHYEAMKEPLKVFDQIRQLGATPVLTFRADTSPEEDFITLAKEVPWVLKLLVNPGFAGQQMQTAAVEHVLEMRKRIDHASLDTQIQADGNINLHTIPTVIAAGASILTGGSSGLFNGNIKQNCKDMIACAEMMIKGR